MNRKDQTHLPTEIINMITTQCDPRTKANCSRVSQDWYHGVVWTDEEQKKRFIQASGLGNEALVKELLGKRIFDNVEASGFREAIAAALKGGHFSIADMLLDRFHKDRRLLPPEIIRMITANCDSRSKANCSTVSRQWNRNIGWTDKEQVKRFISACALGNIQLVNELFRRHPNVFKALKTSVLIKAMVAAAKGNHKLILKRLIKRYTLQSNICDKAFHVATEVGQVEAVRELLPCSSVQALHDAIILACREGHLAVIKLMLADKRVDLRYSVRESDSEFGHDDEIPLLDKGIEVAARAGHTQVLDLLLKILYAESMDHDEIINRALMYVVERGHNDAIMLLLANPKHNIWPNALWWAGAEGNMKAAKKLLRDKRVTGFSHALWNASEKGHANVVKLLLADGRANPKEIFPLSAYETTPDGWTYITHHYDSLQIASKNRHVKVVDLLLRDGRADPTVMDHRAIDLTFNKATITRLLADRRVDPVVRHNTQLLMSSLYGSADDVSEFLSDAKAKPSFRDNIILEWAIRDNQNEIIKLLKQDGRIDEQGRAMIAQYEQMLKRRGKSL